MATTTDAMHHAPYRGRREVASAVEVGVRLRQELTLGGSVERRAVKGANRCRHLVLTRGLYHNNHHYHNLAASCNTTGLPKPPPLSPLTQLPTAVTAHPNKPHPHRRTRMEAVRSPNPRFNVSFNTWQYTNPARHVSQANKETLPPGGRRVQARTTRHLLCSRRQATATNGTVHGSIANQVSGGQPAG